MQLADTMKATGEIIDLWEAASRYQQTLEAHRLDRNLTSDFLIADMSNSAHTWDLDKGEDGKERDIR